MENKIVSPELLEQMQTLQYWFNCAWDAHVVKGYPLGYRGVPGGAVSGDCLYRVDISGKKELGCCALGAGIPDDFYHPAMDARGDNASNEMLTKLGVYDSLNTDLLDKLSDLQGEHDGFARDNNRGIYTSHTSIEAVYRNFAEAYDLTIPSEVNRENN